MRRVVSRLYLAFSLLFLGVIACGGALPDEGEPLEFEPGPELFLTPMATSSVGGAGEVENQPTQEALPAPTADPAQLFENALKQLDAGRILYNPPGEMTVGQRERVEARITLAEAVDLQKGLQGSGQPVEEPLQVSRFMKVTLVGENFSITPLNSDEQLVLEQGFTEWAWDVVPESGGPQRLVLRVTARVKIPGMTDEQRDLEIIEREIAVDVDWGAQAADFLAGNLEWLIPTFLLPIIAGGAARLRRRNHSA